MEKTTWMWEHPEQYCQWEDSDEAAAIGAQYAPAELQEILAHPANLGIIIYGCNNLLESWDGERLYPCARCNRWTHNEQKYSFAIWDGRNKRILMQLIYIFQLTRASNTLRPKKYAAIFQTTFSDGFSWKNIWSSIKISLKFVTRGSIINISALV